MQPLFLLHAAWAVAPKPHVLFIVADDFGYNDVGYHQSTRAIPRPHPANPKGRPTTDASAGVMPTPTLDALAGEGTKLEMYYVQPLCSPTRATFMTGRYSFHTGLGPDVICTSCGNPYGLPPRETLLPELLSAAGYATAAIGKWHLGDCDKRYLPTARGFDHFLGYMAGAQDYYNHVGDFRNGSATATDALPSCVGDAVKHNYSTTLYVAEASRVVDAHAAASAAKPLFMYLAFQSVHNPYDVPPPSIVDVNATFPAVVEYDRRIYAGMVKALDLAVDAVVSAWKRAGLWGDTVLIFTTDNGGIEFGNNYPLRGAKVHVWEGGVRGVGFVRGTNSALARVAANASSVQLMHSTDWLPTLAHIAGVALVETPATAAYAGSAALRPGGATTLHAKVDRYQTLPLDGCAILFVIRLHFFLFARVSAALYFAWRSASGCFKPPHAAHRPPRATSGAPPHTQVQPMGADCERRCCCVSARDDRAQHSGTLEPGTCERYGEAVGIVDLSLARRRLRRAR